MDSRPNRKNKAAFSNFSGVVWTTFGNREMIFTGQETNG